MLLGIGYEAWLICYNEDTSKKFMATENLVFDFELFLGGRFDLLGNISRLALADK
jgi:hypothetical protein